MSEKKLTREMVEYWRGQVLYEWREGDYAGAISARSQLNALCDMALASLAPSAEREAVRDVLAERRRQVEQEGFHAGHDDDHGNRELALAALCYANHYVGRAWVTERGPTGGDPYDKEPVPNHWPWDDQWWKPKNPRRDLVRAAALLLAEIERLDRAALSQPRANWDANG